MVNFCCSAKSKYGDFSVVGFGWEIRMVLIFFAMEIVVVQARYPTSIPFIAMTIAGVISRVQRYAIPQPMSTRRYINN